MRLHILKFQLITSTIFPQVFLNILTPIRPSSACNLLSSLLLQYEQFLTPNSEDQSISYFETDSDYHTMHRNHWLSSSWHRC